MRVSIPHQLPREDVRRRLRERAGDIAGLVPGGAEVRVNWPDEDRMEFAVTALGRTIPSHVEIGETEIVIEIALPGAFAFAEPMLLGAIEAKGRKLVA